VVFLQRLDLTTDRLELLLVPDQVEPHPMVPDVRLAFGQIALQLLALERRLLVLLGQLSKLGLMFLGFVSKLIDRRTDRSQRLLKLTQSAVKTLKTHQPGYLVAQFFTTCLFD